MLRQKQKLSQRDFAKELQLAGCDVDCNVITRIETQKRYVAVSGFVGYLKRKSSTLIYEQFGELKYKYKNRLFWCKGYYVDTVGKNTSRIAEYIRNQLEEDKLGDQLSIAEVGYLSKKKK